MSRSLTLILLYFVSASVVAQAETKKPHDYLPYSFSQEYTIATYKDMRFGFFNFLVDHSGKRVRVEGRLIKIEYQWKGPADPISALELFRTLPEYVKSAGGQTIFQSSDDDQCIGGDGAENHTARYDHNGTPIWVTLTCYGGNASQIAMVVVEEKEFQLPKQPPEALKRDIDTQGKAILHINFDFNRATIRPDAKPLIQNITALLKGEPQLKLEVDGYTDSVGSDDYNKSLSEARARSVVAGLVAAGIDASRLSAAGFGASNPIEDNTSEQGRAENRRVELLKK